MSRKSPTIAALRVGEYRHGSTIPESSAVSNIHDIGSGFLGNDQKFTDAGIDQALGVPHLHRR